MRSSSLVLLLTSLLTSRQQAESFAPSSGVSSRSFVSNVIILDAKKRRKRKIESSSDELPDFEIRDGDAPTPKKKSENKSRIVDGEEITDAMMGSSNQRVRSVRELISDRQLESKFEFDDDAEAADLPDLAITGQPAMGRKKARQAARQAAAEAARKEAEQRNFFENFDFLTNEQGKVTPVKILEAGTWAGIFLLIAWEVYINSPLFDRAAPMAPVVY